MLFSQQAYSKPVVEAEKKNIIQAVIERDKNTPVAASLDTAVVKRVYADEKGIRAVLIESQYAIDSIEIDSQVYDINSEPDSSGYIYAYFDGIEYNGNVKVDIEGREEIISPVSIVETNEKWTVSEDGHTLCEYKGGSGDIVVPNFYKNEIITTIGGGDPIAEKNGIKSVVISEGISYIGDYCFYEMNSLTSATLPSTTELIGGAAFAYTSLGGAVEIPEGVKEIYAYAFSDTDITSLRLNEGLERLCSYAFGYCKALGGTIELPHSLYYLGGWAFVNCTSLSGGIRIPGGVANVGDGAFFNCQNMKGEIVLEEGVEEIGLGAFGAESAAKSGFTAVHFPSSLKKIGPYAFQLADDIKHIELNEGLEIISDGAFDHMTGIDNESLVIPSTVRTIGGDYNVSENTGYGGHVFYDMGKNDSFKAIEVAEGNEYFTSVEGVLYSADMKRLVGYPRGKRDTIYEIPEGVIQLDELCFSRAAYLNKIILPDSYVISEEVPPNVLNQDGNSLSVALYVYTAVNYVDVKPTNENYCSENGILYSKDKKSLWYIPNQYKGDISVAEGTQRIEKGSVFIASRGNTNWGNIYLPQTVSYIHEDTAEFIYSYFRGYCYGDNNGRFLYGDMNGNSRADRADAIILLKDIAVTGSNIPPAGDYNMDGKIDITDVIALMKAS